MSRFPSTGGRSSVSIEPVLEFLRVREQANGKPVLDLLDVHNMVQIPVQTHNGMWFRFHPMEFLGVREQANGKPVLYVLHVHNMPVETHNGMWFRFPWKAFPGVLKGLCSFLWLFEQGNQSNKSNPSTLSL